MLNHPRSVCPLSLPPLSAMPPLLPLPRCSRQQADSSFSFFS